VNATDPKEPKWLGGLAAAALGATLASSLAAALDATAAGDLALGASCFGLLTPLAVPIALGVWAARCLFASGEALAPWSLWSRLEQETGERRAAWLTLPPLSAAFGLLGLVALSGVAARLFSVEVRGPAAMATVGLAILPLTFASLAAVRSLSTGLGPRVSASRLSPRWVMLGSLLLFGAGLSLLIAFGETGGGGGPLGILGVLRRQELDLRAPGLLLLVALGAALLPRARSWSRVLGYAVLVLLPWASTARAASGLSEDAALAIERQAPLSRIALSVLRKVTDRDHDGVSARFAGGDCNDHDPSISPRALDVPGNGKDEDCSGADAKPPETRAAAAGELSARASAAALVPSDLNVVLVTIDTLRADLGYLGNPRPLSPNLDKLAARGVVFERAYSLASYTGKSMGPLLIGKYSSEVEGGFSHFNKYGKRETFVQERLKAAGVRTLSVQGYWYFFKDAGFERGFDQVDSSAAPKVASIEGDQSSNSDEQADAAIKMLESPELADKRFFMWMHFVDPHAEYAPHPEHDFGPKPRDRYDGEVAFVDHHLGRVLQALEKTPFGARTAVVVTSDHGEAFGEHGMIRHGFELWEELVRVPLIVSVPGIAPRRVTARRSAIDLVPTLLDLQRVAFEARGPNDFLSGGSLLPDLLRAAGEAAPERPVFVDMARGPYNAERRALIDGDQKLTVSEGRVLGLYDLAQDPGEKTDLSRDKPRVAAMRDKLATFTSRLRPVPMPSP
jgi:choline-sulfatase